MQGFVIAGGHLIKMDRAIALATTWREWNE